MDLINPSDFRSIELDISLVNLDTSVEFRDGKRIFRSAKGDKSFPVQGRITVVEFIDENGLAIDCPQDLCERGHKIKLEIAARQMTPMFSSAFEAEVRKVERGDVLSYGDDAVERIAGQPDRVTLELRNLREEDWKAFKGIFGNRQAEIEEFFRAAKGY